MQRCAVESDLQNYLARQEQAEIDYELRDVAGIEDLEDVVGNDVLREYLINEATESSNYQKLYELIRTDKEELAFLDAFDAMPIRDAAKLCGLEEREVLSMFEEEINKAGMRMRNGY